MMELETRGQLSKKSWCLHRADIISALYIQSATFTKPAMPSQSLIK